jgi:hypothetical protein
MMLIVGAGNVPPTSGFQRGISPLPRQHLSNKVGTFTPRLLDFLDGGSGREHDCPPFHFFPILVFLGHEANVERIW